VQLLIAKSRVAPLKSLTIPRLELLAACLLAQLANKVIETLNKEITQQFYWTDSTIVLAWLAREPIHWQSFVAHRVADIQSKTNVNNWYHVDSADNPASPSQLRDNELWWHGPSWLKNSTENYRIIKISNQNLENIPEKKGLSIVAVVTNEELDIFTKCSDFPKLKRVVAYVCRFINNAKRVNNKITGPLTTEELNVASNVIVKSSICICILNHRTGLQGRRDVTASRLILWFMPNTLLGPQYSSVLGMKLGKSHRKCYKT
jgi:hypothetical protein